MAGENLRINAGKIVVECLVYAECYILYVHSYGVLPESTLTIINHLTVLCLPVLIWHLLQHSLLYVNSLLI